MEKIKFNNDTFYLINNNSESILQNNLKEILLEKNISASDLSKMTGISKHRISEIINKNVIPKVDAVAIIAFTLNISMEEIFSVNKNSYEVYQNENNETMYYNTITHSVVTYELMKKEIKASKFEYFDTENKKLITKEEYAGLCSKYKKEKFDSIYNEFDIDESKSNKRKKTFEILEEELSNKYTKIYQKLYIKKNLYKAN